MVKLTTYLREVKKEVGQVTWPTRKITINKTMLVIGVSLAIALYIAFADLIFRELLDLLIS